MRTKQGAEQQYRNLDRSTEGVRKRRATANRVLTVLKAALNHAWKGGHAATDDAWRRVHPFKAVETARIRYLLEAECARLANTCEPAYRDLVTGALLTGCRYSELTRKCFARAGVIGAVAIDQPVVVGAAGTVIEQKLTADLSVIWHEQD